MEIDYPYPMDISELMTFDFHSLGLSDLSHLMTKIQDVYDSRSTFNILVLGHCREFANMLSTPTTRSNRGYRFKVYTSHGTYTLNLFDQVKDECDYDHGLLLCHELNSNEHVRLIQEYTALQHAGRVGYTITDSMREVKHRSYVPLELMLRQLISEPTLTITSQNRE